jgi:phosphoribosyl-dephospho-CoA transferase
LERASPEADIDNALKHGEAEEHEQQQQQWREAEQGSRVVMPSPRELEAMDLSELLELAHARLLSAAQQQQWQRARLQQEQEAAGEEVVVDSMVPATIMAHHECIKRSKRLLLIYM